METYNRTLEEFKFEVFKGVQVVRTSYNRTLEEFKCVLPF